MAAAAQLGNLKEEATCSICLEDFTDPVMTDCGHNFCRSCITQIWEGRDGNFPCPECRATSFGKNLRPNRQLRNMVEMLKQLHLPPPPPPVEPQGENLCKKHDQTRRLFCVEDQMMICFVCWESKEHKSHSASPVEVAAEEYKEKLQRWLSVLKKEEEYSLESKVKEKKRYKTMRNKLRTKKKKIESECEKLRQHLKENDQTLHKRLKKMEKKITMVENANITKLSNQITSLKAPIAEIEKKCEVPAWELLKNKLRTKKKKIESECEKLRQLLKENEQTLHRRLEEMEKKITMVENANITKLSNEITSLKALIAEIEKKCEAPAWELLKNVRSTLVRCNKVNFRYQLLAVKNYRVMVTLDPDTAHPLLLLSEGGRRVRWTDIAQLLPDTPKRFTSSFYYYCCVLGSEGFTSGKHYWEVQLLQKQGGWIVGVAAESVTRKRWFIYSPEERVWVLRGCNNDYEALTSPVTPLFPSEKPLKLGVYLDYEGGRLSLYNADPMELLYTFPQALFTERLFPIFSLGRGVELRLE